MLRTAFFGSSTYVIPVLNALKSHTDLRLVITQPDKPVGRRQLLTPSPPKIWALEHDIEVATPETPGQEIRDMLQQAKIHLAIVADYGLLIPKDIFTLPKYQTVNIHFSRLPDLRGPSPVQWTILRGDQSAWISFMQLAQELDAGPILWQKELPLLGTETTGSLYQELFVKAAELLPGVLVDYTQGKLTPTPQDSTKASFTRHLTRDDGFVPWEVFQTAMKGENIPFSNFVFRISNFIERMLRAFTPWPGIWTIIKVKSLRLKILAAHVEKNKLVLDEVQLAGKKPVTWRALARGFPGSI